MMQRHGSRIVTLSTVSVLMTGIALASTGCATGRAVPRSTTSEPSSAPISELLAIDSPSVSASASSSKEDENAEAGASELSKLADLEIESNPHVEKWIRYFSDKDRERFHRFLQRGSQYKQAVEDILEETGIPSELYYLAMIESGYQTRATSHASAAGVWQFISATGKRYGLQFDSYVDERRDPIRSTEAAAKYLRDLYNVFGSWPLALAAYNSGEGRVMNAIMRGKSRNFWVLRAKGVLPAETADYVPKFFAATLIGRDPEKHGFTEIQSEKYPDLEAIAVPSPIRLSDIARSTGVPLEELLRVNPHIRRGVTPASNSTYEIWVPAPSARSVTDALPKLASFRLRHSAPARALASASPPKSVYVVRPGDTLASIARNHSTSVAYLRRINDLSGSRLLAGTALRLSTRSYRAHRQAFHHVVRGENLNSISRRYGMSLSQLKHLNGIRGDQVRIGQRLRVASN